MWKHARLFSLQRFIKVQSWHFAFKLKQIKCLKKTKAVQSPVPVSGPLAVKPRSLIRVTFSQKDSLQPASNLQDAHEKMQKQGIKNI